MTNKRGAPPRGLKAYFLQTKFILSGNRFSFSEEETTAFRVRFLLFEHHLFPRTPFIPCGFIIAIAYHTALVLKGRSLYRSWNLQIIFVCGVFLSLSARLAGRKLGKLQLPHTSAQAPEMPFSSSWVCLKKYNQLVFVILILPLALPLKDLKNQLADLQLQ